MYSQVVFNWFPSLSLFSAPLYLVTPVPSSLSPSQLPSLPARKPPAAALQTQLGPDPGAARPGAALRHRPVPHPHGVSSKLNYNIFKAIFQFCGLLPAVHQLSVGKDSHNIRTNDRGREQH